MNIINAASVEMWILKQTSFIGELLFQLLKKKKTLFTSFSKKTECNLNKIKDKIY